MDGAFDSRAVSPHRAPPPPTNVGTSCSDDAWNDRVFHRSGPLGRPDGGIEQRVPQNCHNGTKEAPLWTILAMEEASGGHTHPDPSK